MKREGLYLGGPIDPASRKRTPGIIDFDPDDLTTHGVIVGMTGSGKTGLGIIYIEELLRRGIPTLILDPKGDMTNLLLTFPDLLPEDFEPWIDDVEAGRQGKTVLEAATSTARFWGKGLAGWGLGKPDIADLRESAEFAIYTPGSKMGRQINLVGTLQRPDVDWEDGAEVLRDEIQSFVSGLLGLVGIDADPISSRDHILLSNLVEHGWRNNSEMNLATLIGSIQQPPIRKLGVFDVDSFFPPDDRRALALKINGLVASPSFSAWNEGEDLDIQRMLWSESGRPRASILYLAHLTDEERQFVAALALSRLVTWMRRQSGTGRLRALVYLDEAFGFAPPNSEPPAKRPIFKQARAFGVGMLVSTQNPMDLDYKAMSNAGTWNIGRLQTERDKARILEGLATASGTTDIRAFDKLISGLGKREFVLHTTRSKQPDVFATRWAMSYLRGPLTGPQIAVLSHSSDDADPAEQQPGTPPASDEPLGADETTVMPTVAAGVRVRFADPAAPWAHTVGADINSRRHRAAIVATLTLLYDETRAGIQHVEQWEAVFTPLTEPFAADEAIAVDHDPRDFRPDPGPDPTFVLPEAPIGSKSYFRSAAAALRDHLDKTAAITVYRARHLNLFSRVGESRSQFESRCAEAGANAADEAAAKLRDKYETKLDRARDRAEAAERRADEIEVDVAGAKSTQWTDIAGTVINFLSGRRSVRGISTTARRRASVKSKEQRLRSARGKHEDLREAIEDLDAELEQELDEIADEWDQKAGDIENLDIGLERMDITVKELTLAWIPV